MTRRRHTGGHGRQSELAVSGKVFICEPLERGAAIAQRTVDQRLSVRRDKQVKGDENTRVLPRQLLNAAGRWMDSEQQLIEGELVSDRNCDLAVQNKLRRFGLQNARDKLREVALQWLARFGLQLDVLTVSKDQASEAVPFRSYCQPSPSGISLTRRASIGGRGG